MKFVKTWHPHTRSARFAIVFAVGTAASLILPHARALEVRRTTIDGSASQQSVSVSFSVTGSIGQPEDSARTSSTSFAVRGGFWVEQSDDNHLFSDGFE